MSILWIMITCAMLCNTLCATVEPSSDLSIEDTIISLKLRVNAMEEKFSSMESTETLVRKVKEELEEVGKKMEGIESSFTSNQKDVSEKLQAIEHTVHEHKEDVSRRLSEVQMSCKNEIQDVSRNLENLKNKHLMMDNHLLIELQQVQKKSFQAMEKVGTVKEEITSALERDRSKAVLLQVKINETREILNAFLTAQQNFEDGIRKNMTSAVGTLELHINESLKSGFKNMQSTLTAERRRTENSLSRLENDCANSSYVTKLGESVRNLNLTSATLRSFYSDLHSRVTQLEERNDPSHEIEEIMKSLKNHTHEISTINRKLLGIHNSCEGEPPSLVNGKSIDFERKLGSKVQYECDRNFVMIRNSTVRCVFGEWEGQQPVCKYFDPTFYAVSERLSYFDCYSTENSKNIEFQLMSSSTEVGVLPQKITPRASNESNGIGYHNVALKDKYGVYRCGFNTEGRSMGIDVVFQSLKTEDPLNFLETFQVANAGDTVELRLHTKGTYPIRCRHNGVLMQAWENKTQVEFRNVQPTQAGIYFCYFWPAEYEQSSKVALMKLIVRKCGANLYGENCKQKCPPCYNGGICHDILGICVCPVGFYGHNCERACPEGHYGTNCSNRCGRDNCKRLFHCKQDPYGCSCARGYKGTWCSESCNRGWYGAGCNQPCHCKNDSWKCNQYTGACSDGCSEGWTGESCQIKVHE